MNIVNVKNSKDYDIYIGRKNSFYNLVQSEWANPFVIGKDGTRPEVIEKYRLWINCQPNLLKKLQSLNSKNLGCWCDYPNEDCHGRILLELSKSKYIKNWFSNMLPLEKPLIYQNIEFKTVENFYQAMKLPKNRTDLRLEIARMSPFEAKTEIRDLDKYLWDKDWNKEKSLKVMEYALKWKFQKGTNWSRLLQLTESWELVEYNNWSDLFWGKDINTEKGENHLGKILMKIREENNV